MRGLRSAPFARAVLALSVLVACSDGLPEPLTVVCYEAEPMLREEAKFLSVFVFDMDSHLVFDDERYVGLDAPEVEYPVSLPVTPAGGDATRFFTVNATLLDASRFELARTSARIRFRQDGERGFVRIRFDDACIGNFVCGEVQTCVQGACVQGCFAPTTVDCESTFGAPTLPAPCIETR